MDEAIWELATRARNPIVRDLLVQTVDLAQVELAKLKDTPDARRVTEMVRDFEDLTSDEDGGSAMPRFETPKRVRPSLRTQISRKETISGQMTVAW